MKKAEYSLFFEHELKCVFLFQYGPEKIFGKGGHQKLTLGQAGGSFRSGKNPIFAHKRVGGLGWFLFILDGNSFLISFTPTP